MQNSLYIDLAVCFLVSVIGCLWWSYRKELLKRQWKNVVAVSVVVGFVGFIFYLLLRLLVPAIGITPDSWLTVPATILMILANYDALLSKFSKDGEDENA